MTRVQPTASDVRLDVTAVLSGSQVRRLLVERMSGTTTAEITAATKSISAGEGSQIVTRRR